MKKLKQIIGWGSIVLVLWLISLTIVFSRRDIPLETLKRKYADTASRFMAIQGMPVHYKEEGNLRDSVAVVLLHGTGSSLHTWDSIVPAMKKTYRIVRLDLPGFGLTGPMHDHDYNASNYVQFLNEFLHKLSIRRCVLAGNSLGGYITWKFALKHPQMVKSMILMDAGGMPVSGQQMPVGFKLAKMPVVGDMLRYITPKFLVAKSVSGFYHDPGKITTELVERYYNLSLRAGNRQAMITRVRQLKPDNDYVHLQKLHIPTLILWGANDKMYPPAAGYKFNQLLPDNEFVLLANTGHLPMEESPALTCDNIRRFLSRNWY